MLHRRQAGRLCISIIGWGAESTEAQACGPDHLGLLTLHRSCDPKHFLTLFGGFLEHLSTVLRRNACIPLSEVNPHVATGYRPTGFVSVVFTSGASALSASISKSL